MLRLPALLGCFMLLAGGLSAQCFEQNGEFQRPDGSPCENVLLTATPFLRIVADARSGAMGDAGIGISADANALQFNASKLVFAEDKTGISATYTPWLRALGLNDVYLAYLSGYTKLDDQQAVGASLRYFKLGEINFTDINGTSTGQGNPYEFEVKASYARKLSDNFSAAIGGKFILSDLASGQQVGGANITSGSAGAADFSFTYNNDDMKVGDTDSELMIGLAVQNIGSKITYTNQANGRRDYLPANLGIGAGWTFNIDDFNKITIAADVNKLLVPTPCEEINGVDCDVTGEEGVPDWREDSPVGGIFASFGDAPDGFSEELQELMYSFGAEYWYDDQFALRAGYYTEHRLKGNRKFFTVGIGLKYNIFGLNFSYLVPTTNQQNPLDNTLRFSLLFDFNAVGADEVPN